MTSPYEGMTAAIYARVSTADETDDGVRKQNYKMQIADIERWCDYHKVKVLKQFIDDGISGGSMDRPGMMQMLGFIALNKVALVVAQDCTRISRDNNDMESFLQTISRYGTVLRYTISDIRPEDGVGKVMNYMTTNEGEQWRKNHSIKVRKGQRHAKENGTKSGRAIGRPKAAIDIELVMECADNGYSLMQTSGILGYKRVTLRDHLDNLKLLEEYYSRCRKTPLSENTVCSNTKADEMTVSQSVGKDMDSDTVTGFSDSLKE